METDRIPSICHPHGAKNRRSECTDYQKFGAITDVLSHHFQMSSPITTAEVHRNFANPCSRWHEKGALPYETDGKLASQRLHQPLFTPTITPGFKLRRKDKLFAIGSCFARGIELALIKQKMDVLSRTTDFDSFPAVNDEMRLGFTNKYNTFSIYNELRWALDPAAEFPRESLVDIGNGLFYDPHTNPALQLAGLEETIHRHEIIESVTRRIAECRVVIITLGLAEVWRDKIANIFLNHTPIPEALRSHPDRYEFHITNFAQNLSNLERIHTLLSQFGHPDVQVVVTVSPVPLMATFSGEDVVIANTYSKSMLRTVAQEWAAAHKNVHYFPSYEIVQNSHRLVTWEEDLRHVRAEVANHIMRLFLRHYSREAAFDEPVQYVATMDSEYHLAQQIIATLQKEHAELETAYHTELRRLQAEHADLQTSYHTELRRLQSEHAELETLYHTELRRLQAEQAELQAENQRHAQDIAEMTKDTRKLLHLLDEVESAAARLRSSRRWKLANPVTAIKAKLFPNKVSLGYGHLEKIVASYLRWRALRPEIAKIDDQIKMLAFPTTPTSSDIGPKNPTTVTD